MEPYLLTDHLGSLSWALQDGITESVKTLLATLLYWTCMFNPLIMITTIVQQSASTRHHVVHFSQINPLSQLHTWTLRGRDQTHLRTEDLMHLLPWAARLDKASPPVTGTFPSSCFLPSSPLNLPVGLTEASIKTALQLSFSLCPIPNLSCSIHRCWS